MGETSRANCHPFTHDNWSFCHNGEVPHYPAIRRQLEAALPDDLYAARRGTTASEMIFLTLLANGLNDDPERALAAMFASIGRATREGPVRLTCVFSDGAQLYAYRYASDDLCPTLYLSETLDNGGRALASEPLCGDGDRWAEVPTNQLMVVSSGALAKAA
jgi:glutamine amidotransferase